MKKGSKIISVLFLSLFWLCSSVYADMSPRNGGTMTVIYSGGPQVLGYYPEMGPGDHGAMYPALECMMEMNEDREMVPFLAKSVDIDEKNLKMTFVLNEGIKFHDGSELTAEVAAWHYQLLKDSKKIQFSDMIDKIEVTDKYTMVLHLNGYHNQLKYSFGWVPLLSKQAFDTKGKEWLRTHIVGTGPFKQKEWKRDVHLIWEKFDDYWQKGKPHLDGIKAMYIPDTVTASALMQAKQADIWYSGSTAKDQKDLEQMGFIRQAYWAGMPSILVPNTKDASKPTYNKKVREAIEYAIDKKAIAKAIGFGYYEPLKTFHPKGEWAYDEDWPGRPYNPEKARQLLKEAGYGKGLKLKLLAISGQAGSTAGGAIQAYLRDVGINLKLDLADPGRYYGSMFGMGWDDLMLGLCGIDYNSLGTVQSWYGHSPRTQMPSYKQTDKVIELSKKSITARTQADMKEYTRQIAVALGEEASIIPLYNVPTAVMIQPWVHTDYLKMGLIRWPLFDTWLEKH